MTRLAGAVLAAVVLATACSGDDQSTSGNRDAASEEDASAERREATPAGDSGDPDSTEPAESTTDVMAREQEAVEEAYVAAMEARIDSASSPGPNPDFPGLAETHVDPILSEWTSQLERWAFTAHVVRYGEVPEVDVLSVTFGWDTGGGSGGSDADDPDANSVGNLATVQACIVDGGQVVHQPSGDVEPQDNADSSGLVTVYEHATMKKVDGAWKLAERRPDKDWPGRAGCAVAGSE